MKKIFVLALALVALATSANAQEKVMKIQRANGLMAEVPVNEVKRVNHSDSPWVSLGYCLYGEDTIGTCFYFNTIGDMCCDYYVEVQENTEQPGLYRLVNPYAPGTYPYADSGVYEDSRDYYIEINATDPDYVYITEQEIGLDINEHAPITICTRGIYLYNMWGYTKEEVRAVDTWGTLKDGVITFPKNGLVTGLPAYTRGYTYGNDNNNFKVNLNDKSDTLGPKSAKKLSAERGEVVDNIATAEDNGLVK